MSSEIYNNRGNHYSYRGDWIIFCETYYFNERFIAVQLFRGEHNEILISLKVG